MASLVNKLGSTDISTFDYTYDGVGNRESMNTTRSSINVNSPLSYTYDDLYRLTEATRPLPSQPVETFTYDPVGNRLLRDDQATSAVFDNANRLLEDQEFTYEYDNNGNLIEKINKSTLEVTQYTYDAENRLIQIDKTGMTATYRYDGIGRRIEKNVNGVITRYVYNGKDILSEFNGSNSLTAKYTYGGGIDEPLIMERGGQSYFYQVDGLGSTTDFTNSAGGVAQSYVYDSFGQIVGQNGSLTNPYTYTGRELDSESGLYYYRARYYDAKIGRFLQEDPIGFEGGDINFYVYVWGNPTTFIDPYGLWGFNWPDLIPPVGGWSCASYFLVSNFYKLNKARNGGLDKYFHCVAFCQVGKYCGITGLAFGTAAGYGKERWDCYFTPSSCDPKDEEANREGVISSERTICCKESCKHLLP